MYNELYSTNPAYHIFPTTTNPSLSVLYKTSKTERKIKYLNSGNEAQPESQITVLLVREMKLLKKGGNPPLKTRDFKLNQQTSLKNNTCLALYW